MLIPATRKSAKDSQEIFAAAPATRRSLRLWCARANQLIERIRRSDEGLRSCLRFAYSWKPHGSARPARWRARNLATVRGRHRPHGAARGRQALTQAIFEPGKTG